MSYFVKSLRCYEQVALTCVASRSFGSNSINEIKGRGSGLRTWVGSHVWGAHGSFPFLDPP